MTNALTAQLARINDRLHSIEAASCEDKTNLWLFARSGVKTLRRRRREKLDALLRASRRIRPHK